MEAKSRQTDIKMTARKLRRVINEVRGKAVNEALDSSATVEINGKKAKVMNKEGKTVMTLVKKK